MRESKAVSQAEGHGSYIVYMGAAGSSNDVARDDQIQLMSSLTTRRKNAVVHSYKNSFSGFAARLSDAEAQSIAEQPGVVSVFLNPVFQLHTTRSWDFLRDQYDLVHDFSYSSGSNSTSNEADTIIGIFDTGIWPESERFNDKGMGPVPSRWKGTCTKGYDFNSSSCNRKLIGARFYDDGGSPTPVTGTPRDHDGHGTHVAATAAGSPVAGASYYGLAAGTAKGGSPGSRIAVYRICTPYGCSGSAIMKAFDDALADGVDIINLSIGQPAGAEFEFSRNPISIGAFHAVEKGILVVSSAGNDGPLRETIVNVVPWIFTIAATTIDRNIETHIPMGRNKLIKLDIAAPGTAILAAWPANDTEVARSGQALPLFNILSGTSLSCPHVSAIAATLKSQNPTWSPNQL
nr:CO(2)-response secreted protease-like isoform X2 [Nicotiana tomentosiformis]